MTDTKTSITPEEALDLWLTVPRKPISPKERAVLDAAQTFHVQFGELQLPVSVWGKAEDRLVLLVHGWGGHRGQLGGFVDPLLAAGFRVAAFDGPAHGDVPGTHTSGYEIAAAMKLVLAELGQPYAIIAHSLGTMAVTVALQDWLKVEKLVFSGPMRRLSDSMEPFLKIAKLPQEIVAPLTKAVEVRFGKDVWETTSLDLQLPKFQIPALVFHDRDDETTPYVSGVAVARAWPTAKFVTTHGLGHSGGLKDTAVIKQVVDFVAA